jgi:WS/DGAT/MGAT family acyltransferase
LSSPRTSFNRALTPRRAVAFGRVPLESAKRIKNAFGVTVNDVVLAACTIALRDYLRARGECPQRAIIATVPVSQHARGETRTFGNRVSTMFIGLPVHLEMATDVLRNVHEQSVGAKKLYAAFAPAMLADWAELASPALFTGAAALFSHWKLAERLPPTHSVVISNIAGPPMSLYAGDAPLVAAYPLGPILEGAVVNITVVSYAGSVDIGVITCPKSVPRPSEIVRAFECAIADLADRSAVSPEPSPRCADVA